MGSTEINPCNLISAKHFEVEGHCTRRGHLKAHNMTKLLQRLRDSQGQRWLQQCYIQTLILGGDCENCVKPGLVEPALARAAGLQQHLTGHHKAFRVQETVRWQVWFWR